MIHKVHPMSSVALGLNVSCGALPKCTSGRSDLVLKINGLELVFGAMEKDAEIPAIHTEEAADFVFVLIFQKDSAKQLAVTLREGLEDAADMPAHFLGGHRGFDVEDAVGFFKVEVL